VPDSPAPVAPATPTSEVVRLPEPDEVVGADAPEHVEKKADRKTAPPPAREPRTASADRPVWATTLAKPPVPPVLPVLQARRVRWVFTMPAGTIVRLPETRIAPPAPAPAVTAGLPKTLPPATATPTPSGEPMPNTTGGLSIARQLGLGVSRIVIDPGHGGHDPGAKGDDTTEAELVLDVALRLEKLLARMPGVEVVLTRRDNQFVPLQERTAIANREGADLFLSIHANASALPAARGIETYFLNFASNQNAAAVAARENATSDQTMGVLQDVVKAIAMNSKRDESRDFATYVQREMLESLRNANKTIKDLGVKQAPFVVLIGASMPSVLAEISFLTNPQEAKLLKSSGYRQRIAQALFEGIKDYQTSLKSASANTQQQD
jgi:N-acetylmuramoyl-L-alanine amidase